MFKIKQKLTVCDELNEKFDLPPNKSKIKVFKKGGINYWNTWDEINRIINNCQFKLK